MLPANQGSESSAPLSNSRVELCEIGGSAAHPANTTCTPSIAIGSSSQTENDGNQVKASNQNPPVSELIIKDATNMLSNADDLKGKDASKDGGSLTSELNPVADVSKSDAADLTPNGVGKRKSVPPTTASIALTVSLVAVCNPSQKTLLFSVYSLYFLIEFPLKCSTGASRKICYMKCMGIFRCFHHNEC